MVLSNVHMIASLAVCQIMRLSWKDVSGIHLTQLFCMRFVTFFSTVCSVGLSGNGTVVLDTAYGEDPVEFSYNYDIEANTKSMRTLQGFSLDADTLFRVGAIPSNPYIDSFQPFVDYYGRADYADHIIQASIMGIDTEMKNGNLNMGSADYAGTGLARK